MERQPNWPRSRVVEAQRIALAADPARDQGSLQTIRARSGLGGFAALVFDGGVYGFLFVVRQD